MRWKRSNSKRESNKSSITRPKKLIKNDYVILVFEAKNVGYFLNNYAARENFLGLAVPTTNSFNCHLFIILSLFTIQHLDQINPEGAILFAWTSSLLPETLTCVWIWMLILNVPKISIYIRLRTQTPFTQEVLKSNIICSIFLKLHCAYNFNKHLAAKMTSQGLNHQ